MIKKLLAKTQNLIYSLNSRKLNNKNKILLIGSYSQLGSIMHELKKNRNNVIIRGSTIVGRSLFRKDVDYFITFRNLKGIKEIIKDIDVIVTTNYILELEDAAIKTGEKLGIPSLSIQHGLMELDNFYNPITATKMAVWGSITKNWFIRKGENAEKIVITGATQFDSYFTKKPKNKNQLLERLKISKNSKIALFAAQPYKHSVGPKAKDYDMLTLKEQKDILNILFETGKKFNLFLIIKLHPTNTLTLGEIEDILPKINYSNFIIIPHGKEELFDLISISDFMITHASTSALQSMILNKPVITIGFKNKKGIINYSEYKCAIQTYNRKMFENAVRTILYNKKSKRGLIENASKFIELYCYKKDGKSSLRIAQLITRLAENKRKKFN